MNTVKLIVITLLIQLTFACSSLNSEKSQPLSAQKVQINQLGFLPNEKKIAIVPAVATSAFSIIEKNSGNVVFEGTLSATTLWSLAGDNQFKLADFSDFVTKGKYLLRVNGIADSGPFLISPTVYDALHDAALKSYYFNRSNFAIESPYAQKWARAAGHFDQQVKVHASAASETRGESSIISSSKGWYDAGDYGKYVVNSGIATYTLLAAYEHYPQFYQNRNIGIPQTNNQVPDILNETLWNLDWLATMQAPTGEVYHKLTTLAWPGHEMPEEDKRERFVIGKSTGAALNFAAVLSMANRVYQPYDSALSDKRERWLKSAKLAFQWAVNNPNYIYQQPDDVSSGEYGDNSFEDEFSWAAAELFVTTKESDYLNQYLSYNSDIDVPSWSYVAYLATSTLLFKAEDIIPTAIYQQIKTKQLAMADTLVQQQLTSNYKVPMIEADFVWGSNAVALNKALVLMQAHKLTKEQKYKDAALSILDYVLGRNPTDYSFVTGFGSKTPLYPHHRISDSDGITAPIPGMIVGGPHGGRQDGCDYLYEQPARTYIDDWCSFATNEIAINWNAPLVYVLAAILEE